MEWGRNAIANIRAECEIMAGGGGGGSEEETSGCRGETFQPRFVVSALSG